VNPIKAIGEAVGSVFGRGKSEASAPPAAADPKSTSIFQAAMASEASMGFAATAGASAALAENLDASQSPIVEAAAQQSAQLEAVQEQAEVETIEQKTAEREERAEDQREEDRREISAESDKQRWVRTADTMVVDSAATASTGTADLTRLHEARWLWQQAQKL
jgi:hypothetical protein